MGTASYPRRLESSSTTALVRLYERLRKILGLSLTGLL
jgi:hypothetical protein